MNIELIIEHLQEMGRTVVQDNFASNIQDMLNEKGYKTHLETTDRDYLVWDDWKPYHQTWGGKREGSGRPSTGRKKQNIYVTDAEFAEVKKLIDKLRVNIPLFKKQRIQV